MESSEPIRQLVSQGYFSLLGPSSLGCPPLSVPTIPASLSLAFSALLVQSLSLPHLSSSNAWKLRPATVSPRREIPLSQFGPVFPPGAVTEVQRSRSTDMASGPAFPPPLRME